MDIKELPSPPVSAERAGKTHSKSNRTIVSQKASEIEIKPIFWLWKNRIARGKISLITGNPGVGKSQLIASISAVVTTGKDFPDKTKCSKGKVIFINAEDDAADTIVPRLTAAGADLELIEIIHRVSNKNEVGIEEVKSFSLVTHLRELEDLIVKLGDVAAIFIDPISAYLDNIDTHKNSDVRFILTPLAKLAEKHNVAIICISHNNKNASQEALHRVIGSIGFVAACRSAFVVVKDRDSDKRLFLPLKNNNGNDKTGLAFNIVPILLEEGIETSKIVWLAELITETADELMSHPSMNDDKSALEEAKEFLLTLLENGRLPSSEIKDLAKAESISLATLRRAKEKLGITARREGFGEGGKFFWRLPQPEDDSFSIDDQNLHTCPTKIVSKNGLI